MKSLFQELFERSPVSMLLVNSDGVIHLVNKYTEKLFQYDRSELIGQKIEILVPESLRDKHVSLVKEYVKTPFPRQMGQGRNLFGVKKDKSLFPIEVGLNPIEDEGEIYVLGSVINISERFQAEERFKAAVDAAPNGMLMIDSKRKIILINQQIEKIFGYKRDELLGSPIEMLIPDNFKEEHPKFVENYLRNPVSRSMGIGRELFGRHKTGKLFSVEIGLQPISTNNETFVISSVVDITYRKSAEQEIKRKTEEIEEFAYRTSHDLRSPLKSISAITDCIIENLDEKDYDLARKNTENIMSLSNKLLNLIEDILTLTRVDTHQENLTHFNFEEYIQAFKEKYQAILQENTVEVQTSFLHNRPLLVQSIRLTQVLDNLLSNGAKYSDQKKEKRMVGLKTFNDMKKFYIHVSDNGVGIPQDHQNEVFGMFKRFHSSETQGSGLGLYLVKKQAIKMEAIMNFESNSNGTCFYLEFPFF